MMPNFDPSKMDPKALMELSQLIQQLPQDKLMKMQTLMHNMMAGFDVQKDMEEFEKSLPPGFREKMMSIMASQPAAFSSAPSGASAAPIDVTPNAGSMDVRDARLTILRAVASGNLSPEEAESALFPTSA